MFTLRPRHCQSLCRIAGAVIAVATLAAVFNGGVRADDGESLRLSSGERLTGTFQGIDDENRILWQLKTGEQIPFPSDAVDSVEFAERHVFEIDPENNPFEVVDEEGSWCHEQRSAIPGWLRPSYDGAAALYEGTTDGFQRWTKRMELGARLIDGNSDQDFLNVAGKFERKENSWLGQLDFGGQYSQSDGDPKTNRWIGNATFDYGRHGNWIVFATTKNEFDEFENLDYRGTYSSGIGYRFVNEDYRRLIVRVGPAFTYERFRDPFNERTSPDGFGELELNWPFLMRSNFESKTTIHPSLADMEIFRMISDNGLLFKLDHDGHWSLKFGLRVEYNSQPNEGRLPADYTTNVLLVYTRK